FDDGSRGVTEIVSREEIKDGGILVYTKFGDKSEFRKGMYVFFDDKKMENRWMKDRYTIEEMQAENPVLANHIGNIVRAMDFSDLNDDSHEHELEDDLGGVDRY
ncbi:MAG: hypothetical protein ACTSSP_11600, partial [Candidatus Asgardarchaeia archaeon]